VSTKKQVAIFIGPPGCGKGSLSQFCVRRFNWLQLSTGSLCRKHIAEQTEIGKQIDFSIKSGNLVDDNLIVTMVEQWLTESIAHHEGIILDGFPRNLEQAESLHMIIERSLPDCKMHIVNLKASDEIVMQRILGRFICENKDCQAVYSLSSGTNLAPKKINVCDVCAGNLMRRTDDSAETIRERLQVYRAFEQCIIDFYRNSGLEINEINAEKPIDMVFEEFSKVVVESA
jgi:adenylate kinase